MLIVTVPGGLRSSRGLVQSPGAKPPMAEPKSTGLRHVMEICGTKISLS